MEGRRTERRKDSRRHRDKGKIEGFREINVEIKEQKEDAKEKDTNEMHKRRMM